MDSEAFLKLNIINNDLSILEIFSREKFSDEKIENLVGELKYKTLIREKLLSEFSYPSQDFVTLIAKEVSSERITAKKRNMFKKLITEELETILANVVLDYRDRQNPIITTPEEIEGFYIVRSILSEIIDSERVAIRDRQSYCAILLDDNQNYTICRLYFNDLDNLAIALFDSMEKNSIGSRVGENVAINKISEIYGFRDKLLKTVRVYLKEKK